MSDRHDRPPQLLVSVRNAIEAAVALAGGCDVLDVKEPSRGPLGMADTATIAAIVELARASDSGVPVSVALGEAAEWSAIRPPPRLPSGIAYLKLGTAHLPTGAAGTSLFSAVQRSAERTIAVSRESNSPHAGGFAAAPHWIAVAYADYEFTCAPSPEQIVEVAATCGCAGLLIDTFSKQQKRLLDWMDDDHLAGLARHCRSLGLTFALAGRLQASDLPRVLAAHPDIIGIRSAACRAGQRTGPIDADALRAFQAALHAEAARQRRVEFGPRVASVDTV